MNLAITPEPNDAERAAIARALEAEEDEKQRVVPAPWLNDEPDP